MSTGSKPEAVELMGLAKTQASEVDLLLQEASTKEATCYQELRVASHSVVDCLSEGLNKGRAEQFQKNFLVIARSFNVELRALFLTCLNENHLSQKKHTELSQANQLLEDKLNSFITQLQNDSWNNADTTTATTKTKS